MFGDLIGKGKSWCGPCRTLGPALEKAVRAAKGAVKMVKIDVDANPAYAGQLRVQSIPAVFAFKDGQPVDGFMGALPESQLKAFIDRLVGDAAGPSADVEALLAEAAESVSLGDVGGAAQAYAQILSLEPENLKAIAGLARCYLANGDAERATEVLEMAPAGASDRDLTAVDPRLLEILVCPVTRGPLDYDRARNELISRSARLAYPIRDGAPVMLPDEARALEEGEA